MKPEIVEENMKLFEQTRREMRKFGLYVSFRCVECGQICSWDDFVKSGYNPKTVVCGECKQLK